MDIRNYRSWMYDKLLPDKSGYRPQFLAGVKDFIQFACNQTQFANDKEIRCPCNKDRNTRFMNPDNVVEHILRNGFMPDYWYWIAHGESEPARADYQIGGHGDTEFQNLSWQNRYQNMVFDAGPSSHFGYGHNDNENVRVNDEESPSGEAADFFNMLNSAQQPLYPGCDAFSELSLAVQLMSLKSDYNLSQGCVDRMCDIVKRATPPGNCVSTNFYETKKLVKKLGLSAIKYDCCINGCMLYYQTNEFECRFCKHPRYKATRKGGERYKPIPFKRMHYLPLIPRLRRLYASLRSAGHMRWHFENRRESGMLCHPSDGEAWKHFDRVHPIFASEPRNVRLGLCSDGFNPFNNTGKPYSCWPVIMTPYNLPPEMCMTTPYMFLTCLIPGPRNPKNRIDVYLQPLIDELKLLWTEGILTYDISTKQNFRMRAALMWTINDYPAYGMLSGWSTAGRLACSICMEETKAFRLRFGGKNSWFDCHRQFLHDNHVFRRNRDAFYKNRVEKSHSPSRLSGDQLWERISMFPKITDVPIENGKLTGYGIYHNWSKRSIFWDLPYWKDNLLRHNLDVMHIEKNCFDNVFHTVMDNNDKTKDNLKARRDLGMYCKRRELELKTLPNGNLAKPKANFTFSLEQRRDICTWVEGIKMPDGHASNLARCVDRNGGKLIGMKSHDCHVFMERLLPIAFVGLPESIWKPLTELSQFFRNLCSTELKEDVLLQMERNIPVILCKLERIFPPGFFDVMEHLPIHLPYEALVGGPVQYRWMYPFERFLHDLKGMVKNRACPEGSICEAYLSLELSYFCSYYFESDVQSKCTRIGRNEDDGFDASTIPTLSVFNQPGRPSGKRKRRFFTDKEMAVASLHVLLNCDEVKPILSMYEQAVRHYWPTLTEAEVEQSVENNFVTWFNQYVFNPDNMVQNEYLKDLAWGPSREVVMWPKFFINGYIFHTKQWSEGKKTTNCGVCIKGEGSSEFYGTLNEVVQLTYPGQRRVVLFNCDWYDSVSNRGIRVHNQYGIVEIKSTRRYPKFDPFVLAQHASQVYYVPYPGRIRDKKDWLVVIKTRPRSRIDKDHTVKNAYQDEFVPIVSSILDDEPVGLLSDTSGVFEEIAHEDEVAYEMVARENEFGDEDEDEDEDEEDEEEEQDWEEEGDEDEDEDEEDEGVEGENEDEQEEQDEDDE